MKNASTLWASVLLVAAACGPAAPQAVPPGTQLCEHCRMMIHDMRFHAQISNANGKLRHFDSIECALLYRKNNPAQAAAFYASDFLHPGSYLTADSKDSVFLVSSKIKSPMGGGILAVRRQDAAALAAKFAANEKPLSELQHSALPLEPR